MLNKKNLIKIIGLFITFAMLITPLHAFNELGLDSFTTVKENTHDTIAPMYNELDDYRDSYGCDTLKAFNSMNALNDYVKNRNAEAQLTNNYEFGLESYFKYLNDSELDQMIDLVEAERNYDDNFITTIKRLSNDIKSMYSFDYVIVTAVFGGLTAVGVAICFAHPPLGAVIVGICTVITMTMGIVIGVASSKVSDMSDEIAIDKNLPNTNILMSSLAKKLVADKELRKLNKGFDPDAGNYTWKPYVGQYWINIVNSLDIKSSFISLSVNNTNSSFNSTNNTVNDTNSSVNNTNSSVDDINIINSSVNNIVNNISIKNVSITNKDVKFNLKDTDSSKASMMSDRVLKDIKGTKPVYNKPYKKHKWYQFWKPIANAIYKIYYNVVLVPVQYAKNTIPVGSRLLKENAQFL